MSGVGKAAHGAPRSAALAVLLTSGCSETLIFVAGPEDTSGLETMIYLATSDGRVSAAIVTDERARFTLDAADTLSVFAAGFRCAASELALSPGPLFAEPQRLPDPARSWGADLTSDSAALELRALPAFVRGWLHIERNPCVAYDVETLHLDESSAHVLSAVSTGPESVLVSTDAGAVYRLSVGTSSVGVESFHVDPPASALAVAGDGRLWVAGNGGLRTGDFERGLEAVPGTEILQGTDMAAVERAGALIIVSETATASFIHRFAGGQLSLLKEISNSSPGERPKVVPLSDGRFAGFTRNSHRLFFVDGDRFEESLVPLGADETLNSVAELDEFGVIVGTSQGSIYQLQGDGWVRIELRRGFVENSVRAMVPIRSGGFVYGGGDGALRQFHAEGVDCGREIHGVVGLSDMNFLIEVGDGFALVVDYYTEPTVSKNPEVRIMRRQNEQVECMGMGT